MRIKCETCGNVGTVEDGDFISFPDVEVPGLHGLHYTPGVLCTADFKCGSGGPEDIYYPHATMMCMSYDLTIIRDPE